MWQHCKLFGRAKTLVRSTNEWAVSTRKVTTWKRWNKCTFGVIQARAIDLRDERKRAKAFHYIDDDIWRVAFSYVGAMRCFSEYAENKKRQLYISQMWSCCINFSILQLVIAQYTSSSSLAINHSNAKPIPKLPTARIFNSQCDKGHYYIYRSEMVNLMRYLWYCTRNSWGNQLALIRQVQTLTK